MPGNGSQHRCPVCRARFRGTRRCSRCGADLTPLMRLAVAGYQLRGACRAALLGGNFAGALALADRAEQLHSTPQGQELRDLCRWLARSPDRVILQQLLDPSD